MKNEDIERYFELKEEFQAHIHHLEQFIYSLNDEWIQGNYDGEWIQGNYDGYPDLCISVVVEQSMFNFQPKITIVSIFDDEATIIQKLLQNPEVVQRCTKLKRMKILEQIDGHSRED